MELTQRRLSIEDFGAVHAIYMHETAVPYLTVDPMHEAEFASILRDYVSAGTFHVFESAQEIVGFMNFTRFAGRSRHVVHIGPLAVKASLHGTGVAQAMVAKALAYLRAAGVRRVELIVELDNPRAIRFYQRQGFVIEGTLRGVYRRSHEDHDVDSHIMALLIA